MFLRILVRCLGSFAVARSNDGRYIMEVNATLPPLVMPPMQDSPHFDADKMRQKQREVLISQITAALLLPALVAKNKRTYWKHWFEIEQGTVDNSQGNLPRYFSSLAISKLKTTST